MGVVAVAGLAAVAVVVVPHLLDSHPMHQADQPGQRVSITPPPPVHVPAHPCRGRPDHHDFPQGTASWVTFCFTHPEGGDREVAHYPRGVLVTGAAALVSDWQRGTDMVHSCPFVLGAAPFTLRVGFTDGTTSELTGDTGYCQMGITPSDRATAGPGGGGMYDALMAALGRQDARAYHRYYPPGPPQTCPPSPAQAGRLNQDGYSRAAARATDLSGVLLALPAVDSLVCRYDATGRLISPRPTHPPAEPLRLAAGSSLSPRPTGFYRARGSVVVALRDRTDTWRTFTITGAGSILIGLTHPPR